MPKRETLLRKGTYKIDIKGDSLINQVKLTKEQKNQTYLSNPFGTSVSKWLGKNIHKDYQVYIYRINKLAEKVKNDEINRNDFISELISIKRALGIKEEQESDQQIKDSLKKDINLIFPRNQEDRDMLEALRMLEWYFTKTGGNLVRAKRISYYGLDTGAGGWSQQWGLETAEGEINKELEIIKNDFKNYEHYEYKYYDYDSGEYKTIITEIHPKMQKLMIAFLMDTAKVIKLKVCDKTYELAFIDWKMQKHGKKFGLIETYYCNPKTAFDNVDQTRNIVFCCYDLMKAYRNTFY
jgi:hypothetical protein